MAAWDFKRIELLRTTGVEESLTLEYKAAPALQKTERAKAELTKDISAFANSAGGALIYGIGEDPKSKHLPGPIDSISRRDFPKEWLEQIANNIRPRIEGLLIHPIPILPLHLTLCFTSSKFRSLTLLIKPLIIDIIDVSISNPCL
jgi:Predicted transcriptional regulator containing an HTH domain and an uncharacterized domain shared with the mammalian protein Schlafen